MPKNEKLTLDNLKIHSFVTSTNPQRARGGNLSLFPPCYTNIASCNPTLTMDESILLCQSFEILCPSEGVPGGGTTC